MNTAYPYKIGKNSDPAMDGVRGRVGQFVFRRLNGITIVSRRPRRPTSQTEAQRDSRQRFRQATEFAKKEMMNADRKAYYKEMAAKSHPRLPNAYTAAIRTYMNRPETVIRCVDVPLVSQTKSAVKTRPGISPNRIPPNRNAVKRYLMVSPRWVAWTSNGVMRIAARCDPGQCSPLIFLSPNDVQFPNQNSYA